MADLFTIKPGVGAGNLRFGASRDEVRSIAGDPVEIIESSEESGSELWIYETFAIAIGFGVDVNLRFVSCETYSMKAAFNGEVLIGLNREEAEAALERAGADDGAFVIDDDGEERIAIPRLGMSLWFEEHVVESVGWEVLSDDDGNPLWPTT